MIRPFNGLIGLHGKPRVGKDTVAAYLIKRFTLLRYGSSVPVKDTTAAMFNIPRHYLDDDTMKDQMDPFWNMTYRQMAQKVGKESSRDVFGENFWVRHVEKMWHDISTGQLAFKGMVLADIRYANEVEWVKAQGGTVFYVVRDDAPKSSDTGHIVDAGLPLALADVIIYNNRTIEELYVTVENEMAFCFGWE
jgi:hypothetical protein